ncbi:bifunctional tetrahydrofolate synthase/dihydrofolate synthase [Vibrio hippocampi]|uniref:Dihydrofolate synthase/folylpolyglutamate synthase n=1 Tax=Vibrio hippocampi TaxID=654686 RepID=A0ABM8ZJK3_9VIBR|nr:bifunctional tetrahydrofolate synthase/dihydrofolate synthase [Vibrio hippocampi]CAH0526569.1 Dihydrofolate synthase/folylpolyglutamate synthase [Vibrio hippocampi]
MSTIKQPQATSPLSMWLDYLNSIHTSAIDLGLDRVSVVAQQGKLTRPAPVTITVAGTNGKGSTCALMEAILLDAGYKVGVYSSPHLIRYNERVRINGNELADEAHAQAFHDIEQLRGEVSLSFFEYATLAALKLFQDNQVDVVLLEVGLGGRLDATNVVDHDVSVITSLAVDHVDWLGDDISKIGFEKAGIFRSGKPAVCGQPAPPSTVPAHADDIQADFYQTGIQFDYQSTSKDTWRWVHGAYTLEDLPKPDLPLMNANTALMALCSSGLDISDVNIVNGLKSARLAGRLQVVEGKPTTLLDVAHNPHSAQYLVSQLLAKDETAKYSLVLGMLHDKDIEQTINALQPIAKRWYLASLDGPRAATADELAQYLDDDMVAGQYSSPKLAYQAAVQEVDPQQTILVVGSFHTVGEVLAYQQATASTK